MPRLANGVYIDRAEIVVSVCNDGNFLGIIEGPNKEYRRICGCIYESMEQVSKEKLKEDSEAACSAS